MPNRDTQPLLAELSCCLPDTNIHVWPDLQAAQAITTVVAWQQPAGLLARLPRLALVHSYGAGVEHILSDPDLPPQVAVARVSGPLLSSSMNRYLRKQVEQLTMPSSTALTIGLLGFGQLGQAAARMFLQQGHPVLAWRRSSGKAEGIKGYTGSKGLAAMLGQTDVLICLLPLTSATVDILNQQQFAYCKKGLYLINVGRGAHLVEGDLLVALNSGQLSGACLDVTRTEPIALDHPLAVHPDIQLTHHSASLTDPKEAAAVIADNYRRQQAGRTLKYQVDRQAGY